MKRRIWLPGEEDDDRAVWEITAASGAPFSPTDSGKVSAWLRVANGTITGSGYSSIPDVLASNPAVQSTDSRRPTAATSANGLPLLRFNGSQVLSWPLAANNNQIDTTGFAGWFKPTGVSSTQRLAIIHNGSGGASVPKFHATLITGGKAEVVAYASSGGLNKVGDSPGSLVTAGAFIWLRFMFVSSGGTDALKALIYANAGAAQTLSFSGTGTLTTLPSGVTGNVLLGNLSNDGTFASPFTGDMGPNLYWLNGDLTAAEDTALMNFEAPS